MENSTGNAGKKSTKTDQNDKQRKGRGLRMNEMEKAIQ